ncbi:MAG: hypothetical protein LBD89_08475 [Tannerellaceae bacterium]|nr:hypothetical protein [Tannerellaceae bacterium]
MKNVWFVCLISLCILFPGQCSVGPGTFRVKFDPTKEVSGRKFALGDLSPGLPRDWDGYQYVVLEFRITTSQRFHLGFTTSEGYNELRIMSYTPNAWNKLAIPLKFFRRLPEANIDLAATYNQPRYTGWINLGGQRGALRGVDSIGVRMRVPIGAPEFELRSVSLSVEDPGDQYLGTVPAVDAFGQSNLVDYEGKIHSLDQLRKEWAEEDGELVSTKAYNYAPYGGYRQRQVAASGYFRVEKIDGRWWFVDPEGYLFLSVGVDCVSAGGGGNVRDPARREGMFGELPPGEVLSAGSNRGAEVISFGAWNLYRRYGENFREKANEQILRRMDRWGLNTIANWSGSDVYGLNRKAYTLQLSGLGMERGLMGLADVYAPGFAARMDSALATRLPQMRDNPWVIGYFVGNEPAWLNQEERLCELILSGGERPVRAALLEFLRDGDTPERRKAFIYRSFATFLQTVRSSMKKHDPNHLNLGIRFGNLAELDAELLEICRRSFDILSFNCYALRPDPSMMDRALRLTDLPMMIGEYHFGTVVRGMAQSLWQVPSERERGVAYRYYTEQAFSHPGLIGTAYFQWNDQDLTGRMDGENYNCGLVDVTDRPYKHQVEAMMETAKRLYGIHSGEMAPTDRQPEKARGHESIPDLWNE